MESEIPLERVHYFEGQLLTVSDLQAEQEYFRASQRRQHRFLHGWGVVCGLEVVLSGPSGLAVEPGVAIDCAGNLIQILARFEAQIPENLAAPFVALQYAETGTAPVANLSAPGSAEDPSFSRIREGFLVEFLDLNPVSGHQGRGPGTPGCGRFHPLCLACLRPGRHGFKVEPRGRRPD